MSFEDRLEKVSSHGPDWVERRKQRRLYATNPNSIFGYRLMFDEFISEDAKEKEFNDAKHHLVIYAQNYPNRFKALISDSLSHVDTLAWLKLTRVDHAKDESEASHQADLYQEMQKHSTALAEVGPFQNQKIAQDIAIMLEANHAHIESLSLPALVQVLEEHVRTVVLKEGEIASYFEKFKKAFIARLLKKIRSSEYPLDESIANERLQSVQCLVVDQITADLAEIWGDYSASMHCVRIAADISEGQRDATMTHELFHALHGQTETEPDTYEVKRMGFSFGPEHELDWLNEAVTEQTAMEFLNRKQSDSYLNERKLLANLYGLGLDKTILYKAYFENYVLKGPGQHRSPQLKAFFHHIQDIAGYPQFLFDLSVMIKTLGTDAVLELWSNNQKFPQYVQKWVKTNPIS